MREINIHPLQQARKKLGIKQKVLADLTGLSEPTIKRAERGDTLEDYTISAICEYFSKRFGRQVDRKELGLRAKWEDDNEETLIQNEEPTQRLSKQPPNKAIIEHQISTSPETLNICGLPINLIVLARGRYRTEDIHCYYDQTPEQLLPEFKRMKEDLTNDLEERKAKGEVKLPYNSETYKLKEFDTGYREIVDGREVPVIRLKFGPTDYFTQMVTDLNIGNPIREKYARAISVAEHPIPEFASMLGINLSLITKDGYLIITERSLRSFVASGKFHTSVGENLLRPLDAGQFGAPDPFQCAIRGAKEELGITLSSKEVIFNTFTVIPDFCQYSLISTIQISQTRAEIEELRQFTVPTDKWENRRLLFYPHNPDSIAMFTINTWNQWFHVALAAVVLSLSDVGYSKRQIDTAFLKALSRPS